MKSMDDTKTPKKKKRVRHDYIDNREFYLAMEEFYNITQAAIADGVPKNELPIPSNYIVKCIIQMAQKMGRSGKFYGYSYNDEMVSDGIEDAYTRIRGFTPKHAKKNAFGYFSMIIWRAFLRRIAKEKKHQYIAAKLTFDTITNHSFFDSMTYDDNIKNNNIFCFQKVSD